MASGWNLWVWLQCIGVVSGCCCKEVHIIESVDSISKDERGFPLTQYITNGRISRGGYTFTHFKHHHRVLRLISYRMAVYNSAVYVRAARS